ncbi:MAG UNVERIFIED_CONTAM: hypothetical protein LVT10_19825 [Anaerolineae bacterium]|jgi:hypothetical protein
MNDVKNVDMGNEDDLFTNPGSTDDTQLGLHGDDSTLVNQPTRMSDAGVVAASDFTDFDDDFARLSEEGSFESGAARASRAVTYRHCCLMTLPRRVNRKVSARMRAASDRSNGFVVGALLLAFWGQWEQLVFSSIATVAVVLRI